MENASIATVQILFKIYLATIFSSVVIAAIQLYSNRDRAQKAVLLYWLTIGGSTFINGLFPENNFEMTAIVSSNAFFSQIILGVFFAEIKQVQISWKPAFAIFLAMLLLSYILSVTVAHPPFFLFGLPAAAGATFPFLYYAFKVMKGKKTNLSVMQRLFFAVSLLMSFHYLDWAFVRPYPQLLMLGFIVAFALFNIQAILIPMMANERIWEIRNSRLEVEVLEKVEQYKKSEDTSRMKDEFLTTVSHELRTPLNAIVGYSELLNSGALDPGKEQKEAFEIIDRCAKLQLKIINQLLEVSTFLAGKSSFEPEIIEPLKIELAILEEIRPMAELKNINIISDFPSDIPSIWADPRRLHQISWNLLSNAIKFTPSSGRVIFSIAREGSNLVFVIEDSGYGIDPNFLPHVFDRFRQEDGSMKRRFEGLGLGLSITRDLVTLHGGKIWAESGGKGKGSRFSFSIPISGSKRWG